MAISRILFHHSSDFTRYTVFPSRKNNSRRIKRDYIFVISWKHINTAKSGCRICRLQLCRGVPISGGRSTRLGYGTEQLDGEAPVLELWGMWNTPLFSLLPCPHRPEIVVCIMDPCLIEIFNHFLHLKSLNIVWPNNYEIE